jgi:hypothetical protein
MAVRVDLKRSVCITLNNVVSQEGDVKQFVDISDLAPPIPERIALLKLCAEGDIIRGVGVKLNKNTYIIQEI